MKKENLQLTQAHPCTCWARATLLLKSNAQFGNRKNVVRFLLRFGQLPRLKHLLSVSEILEDSRAVLSPGNFAKQEGILTNGGQEIRPC